MTCSDQQKSAGAHSRRSLIALRVVLSRLLWCALNPGRGITTMPPGWVHASFYDRTVVPGRAERKMSFRGPSCWPSSSRVRVRLEPFVPGNENNRADLLVSALAMEYLRGDFQDSDSTAPSTAPRRTAEFLYVHLDADTQADAVGFVRQLFKECGL